MRCVAAKTDHAAQTERPDGLEAEVDEDIGGHLAAHPPYGRTS